MIGLILGIIYKTYAPYQSKLNAGVIDKFNPRYIWTAIAALIGATVTAFQMFNEVAIAWAEGWPFGTGYVAELIFGFFWAIGFNHTLNQLGKPTDVLPPTHVPVIMGRAPEPQKLSDVPKYDPDEPLPELNKEE